MRFQLTADGATSLPSQGNTSLPPAYDVLWAVISVAAIALWITGMVLLFKAKLSPLATLLWIVAMFMLPILGPVAFIAYRRSKMT